MNVSFTLRPLAHVFLAMAVLAPPAIAADPEAAVVHAAQGVLQVPGIPEAATGISWAPVTLGVPVVMLGLADPRDPGLALRVLATEVAAAGLAEGLKALILRPRPFISDPTLQLPAGPADSTSMPSGHAAVGFAGAATLAALRPDLAPWAWGWATAVSITRVVLGVHYPTDILAGALLGLGTAATAAWLVPLPAVPGPR
ncbi:MAG: phosphatase PAP2 family protein [Candidatus Sericytochromatia bacterium]|nr:phosphatase PAP2 family protein [Candidatus Sericytochromatia bacterium]